MIRAAVLFALALSASTPALAQTTKNVPNALQGFSQNRNQPVQIDADSLEVREPDRLAIFSGDVRMSQGDTRMKARTIKVYYEQTEGGGTKGLVAAKPGPGGSQQIRRLEADGGVEVAQKDQKATGQSGVFDMKSNTVTLSGNVLLTQGQNVLRGERLIVDLSTGVSRVEAGKSSGGRVQGLFTPSSGPADAIGKPASPSASRPPVKPSDRPKP